MLLYLLVDHRT